MSHGGLEEFFPGLRNTPYRETSPQDPRYNCIAWAAGDAYTWWEPDQFGQYTWPPGTRREYTLAAYAAAYAQLGYDSCDSPVREPGVEKVAIFVDTKGIPTHAARQLPSGRWTSKLGRNVDVEHELSARRARSTAAWPS